MLAVPTGLREMRMFFDTGTGAGLWSGCTTTSPNVVIGVWGTIRQDFSLTLHFFRCYRPVPQQLSMFTREGLTQSFQE